MQSRRCCGAGSVRERPFRIFFRTASKDRKICGAKLLIFWRSLGKWCGEAKTIGCVHKHPYPRSLNLKAVLPQLQTVAIASAAERRVSAAPPRNGKAPHSTCSCAQTGHRQFDDPHSGSTIDWRSVPRRPVWFQRGVGPSAVPHPQSSAAVLIADKACLDVECYVIAPAMEVCVPAQRRAGHEQAG